LILPCAALLSLPACWTGGNLYSPADARPAIAPGVYRERDAPENETARISLRADGLTELTENDGSGPTVIGLSPIDGAAGRYVVWFSEQVDGRTIDDVGLYGLLVRTEADELLFFLPQCDETEQIAVAAGAVVERFPTPMTCRFPDRSSLERAMRQFRPRDDEASLRLVRTGM
jgi:hypothetical protein